MSSQKNTFAVTMTLLLALVLGGSVIGFKKATATTHEAAAHAPEAAATGAAHAEAAPAEAAAAGAAAGAAEGAAGASAEAHAETAAAAAPVAQPAGDGDVEAGKTKFAASCGGCHGMNAEGGMAPNMANAKGWSLEQFTAAVRELKTPEKELKAPMMKFDANTVSDADLANMYAYLKTIN